MKKSTLGSRKKELYAKNASGFSSALKWELSRSLYEIVSTWLESDEFTSSVKTLMGSMRFRLVFEDELVDRALELSQNCEKLEESNEFLEIIQKMQKEAEKIIKWQIPTFDAINALNKEVDKVDYLSLYAENKEEVDYYWFNDGVIVINHFEKLKNSIITALNLYPKVTHLDIDSDVRYMLEKSGMFVDFCSEELIEEFFKFVVGKYSDVGIIIKIIDACLEKAYWKTALQGLVIKIAKGEVEYKR